MTDFLGRSAAKIGWIPAGDESIASSRYRAFNPIRELRKRNVPVEIYKHRRRDMYSTLVVQKNYDPSVRDTAEAIRARGGKVILDLCDNHFLFVNGQGSDDAELRRSRLEAMLLVTDLVTVSSEEMGRLVESTVDLPCYVVDDMIDSLSNRPFWRRMLSEQHAVSHRYRRSNGPLRLVWFGNAGSELYDFGMIDLGRIIDELNVLSGTLDIQLTVISNSEEQFQRYVRSSASFPVEYEEWDLSTFEQSARSHDACVMPIRLNDFTRYKTANRVATAVFLGLPVVTSMVPSYERYAAALYIDNWASNLQVIANSPDEVADKLQLARELAEMQFFPEPVCLQWQKVFLEAGVLV